MVNDMKPYPLSEAKALFWGNSAILVVERGCDTERGE